jgi:glycosyltransferase involved in cell wall biosynthesis
MLRSRQPSATDIGPVRLTIFAASPIYYSAVLYRQLAADPRISLTVLFGSTAGVRPYDLGYQKAVAWDVDTLAGFDSMFLGKAESNAIATSFLALRDLSVIRLLRQHRPEVLMVHGYNSVTHVAALALAHAENVPLLVREEQTLLDSRPLWKRAIKAAALPIILKRSRGLFIGTHNRAWFEHFGVRSDRLFFTPYVVDNQWLRASCGTPTREEAARRLGVVVDKNPIIATTSRLIEKKQPLALLTAFGRVREQTMCSLLVAGSGPAEHEMRALVDQLEIPDVHFLGYVKQAEIALVYSLADIFVLFSGFNETWGLVVNEAMNFECPIVVSDRVGSAPDLVVHGENGFVVDHNDIELLAARLLWLVCHGDERRRFGLRSRALIDTWTVDAAAAGVVDAVANAVGRDRWERADEAPLHGDSAGTA